MVFQLEYQRCLQHITTDQPQTCVKTRISADNEGDGSAGEMNYALGCIDANSPEAHSSNLHAGDQLTPYLEIPLHTSGQGDRQNGNTSHDDRPAARQGAASLRNKRQATALCQAEQPLGLPIQVSK